MVSCFGCNSSSFCKVLSSSTLMLRKTFCPIVLEIKTNSQTKILCFYIWIYLPRFTCDNITAFSLNVSESSNFDYVKKYCRFSRWSRTFRLHCMLYIFYVCYTACRVTYVYCTSVSSVKSNQLMDQHLVGAEHVCAALTVILLALLRAATHSLMSVASLAWRKYRRETALMTAEIDIDSMNFHNNHIITFNHMLKMKLTPPCPAA